MGESTGTALSEAKVILVPTVTCLYMQEAHQFSFGFFAFLPCVIHLFFPFYKSDFVHD